MNLFADHPPLEQRLAALQRLESQLAGHRRRLSRGPARHPHGPPPGQGPGARPLFAITTAYVTLETEHRSRRRARPRSSSRRSRRASSKRRSRTWKKSSRATGGESGTTVSTQDDSYGYRWMVLRNPQGAPSVEDLAVGINAVPSSIETAGLRRAAAVRGVRLRRRQGRPRSTSSTTTSAATGTRSCPDQAASRSAQHRARAADQGPGGRGTAGRARDRALVPAVGDPDLRAVDSTRPPIAKARRGAPGRRARREKRPCFEDNRRPQRASQRISPGSGPRR